MKKDKITLIRDKHLIYIKNPKFPKKEIRYNLQERRMEKFDKELRIWTGVSRQYPFFYGFSIGDIDCAEEKFKEMLKKTKDLNPYCYSLSTFFERLREALAYENYINFGLKTRCYVSRDRRWRNREVLTKPVEFYHKDVIAFFKKYDIEITPDIEKSFEGDYGFMKEIIYAVDNSEIETEKKLSFFDLSVRQGDIHTLVKTYKYELKALINYIYNYLEPFENLEDGEAVDELEDYYRMAGQIGREVKKYPKYLRSMHDIIVSNFNAFEKKYNEELFKKIIKHELEHKGKEYLISVPKNTKDIISEGTNLNHCVGSYIDKILKGQTYIFFLRKTEFPEQSLITLELVNNQIINAKGSYNRIITKEERDFLEKYCKLKNLKLNINGG